MRTCPCCFSTSSSRRRRACSFCAISVSAMKASGTFRTELRRNKCGLPQRGSTPLRLRGNGTRKAPPFGTSSTGAVQPPLRAKPSVVKLSDCCTQNDRNPSCVTQSSMGENSMLAEASAPRVLTSDEILHALRPGNLVLDTRPAGQFAHVHIRGSIQISLAGNFASWAAIVFNPAQELILIVEDAKRALEAYNRLARVGLGNVIGYSLVDEQHWRDVGLELASISIERSEQIQRSLKSDPSLH